ncbi:hypothetical protein HMPREF1556_00966 [Porphyromonas sp. oral taxon 278 str. W7784]|nr:hypothetical protein HMPREF1556_00966 [Porphyromonas sp. oral taxon 278 str. W7784]
MHGRSSWRPTVHRLTTYCRFFSATYRRSFFAPSVDPLPKGQVFPGFYAREGPCRRPVPTPPKLSRFCPHF